LSVLFSESAETAALSSEASPVRTPALKAPQADHHQRRGHHEDDRFARQEGETILGVLDQRLDEASAVLRFGGLGLGQHFRRLQRLLGAGLGHEGGEGQTGQGQQAQ